jgi:hypothetical protein
VAHLVFSLTVMAFLTNKSETRKSASSSAIQLQNRLKTIGTEEKLHVISRREKGDRIVDTCRNARFAHGTEHKIHDNADSIKESVGLI